MTAFDIICAINQKMTEAECSRKRIAQKIFVDRRTVSNWLNMETPIRLDAACEMLHYLGLDLQVVYNQRSRGGRIARYMEETMGKSRS